MQVRSQIQIDVVRFICSCGVLLGVVCPSAITNYLNHKGRHGGGAAGHVGLPQGSGAQVRGENSKGVNRQS